MKDKEQLYEHKEKKTDSNKKEIIKKLIFKDQYLTNIFAQNNYICDFNDENWWLFNQQYLIDYFNGLKNLCSSESLSVSNCKQEIKGYRNTVEVHNGILRSSLIECNCNIIDKLEYFYYYYDFPSEKLKLNFKNSNFFFKKIREDYVKTVNVLINNVKNNNNKVNGIYLHSKKSNGKTFVSILLANELAKLKKSVLFISMSTLIYKLQNWKDTNIDTDYVNKKNFHKLCLEAKFLFIDNIGSGYINNWVRDNILFNILEYRSRYNLVTFYTSNLSLNELGEWFLNNSNKNDNSSNSNFHKISNFDYVNKNSTMNILKKIAQGVDIFSWN